MPSASGCWQREGNAHTKGRAAVCSGLHEPWKIEEVDIAPPGPHEVIVQTAYAGMCHSDEHLRTGDAGGGWRVAVDEVLAGDHATRR